MDPDVVLTQDLCRVCALPADRVDEALAHLGCRALRAELNSTRGGRAPSGIGSPD